MKKRTIIKIVIVLLLQVFTIQFLTAQPIGFASLDAWGQNGTTGGAGGPTVTVTNSSDLLDYISREGPYIIQVDGMISVGSGMHEVTSDKTIIGLGDNSGITGGGLNVGLPISNDITEPPSNAVHNVIICNLTFDDANDDNINVMMFSHHFWIHHNTFLDTADGQLDIKRGSSYGTVSYNHFVSGGKTMLLGHSDDNDNQDIGRLKVTYHHNWFDHGNSRHPRCRFGEAHIFNNYYDNIGNYGIGVGKMCRVYSENNYCEGGNFYNIMSNGDSGGLKDVGSIGGESVNPGVVTWNPSSYYSYTADPAGSVPDIVMANAGVGKMGELPTLTPTLIVFGDVNNDGVINIVDALIIAQCSVGIIECPPIEIGDTNCDGSVNIVDALLIAQFLVGLINQFC
jgi:pectate lyase